MTRNDKALRATIVVRARWMHAGGAFGPCFSALDHAVLISSNGARRQPTVLKRA
jgi:hypothetical protein